MTKILVVKRPDALRDHLVRRFRALGHHVDVCERGDVAFDMMRHAGYAFVVSDIALDGLDGLDLVDRTRRAGLGCAVYLTVGFSVLPTAAIGDGSAPPMGARESAQHMRDFLARFETSQAA